MRMLLANPPLQLLYIFILDPQNICVICICIFFPYSLQNITLHVSSLKTVTFKAYFGRFHCRCLKMHSIEIAILLQM